MFIENIVAHGYAEIGPVPRWQSLDEGITLAVLGHPFKMKAEYKIHTSIAFAEIEPFKGEPVLAILQQASDMCERTIFEMEANGLFT